MLKLLAKQNKPIETSEFLDNPPKYRNLRVGVANNLEVNKEVLDAFQNAVDEIKGFGYPVTEITHRSGILPRLHEYDI